jgi:Mg-chelatase subunit ChlD
MRTIRPWAVWRRLQYGVGFFVVIGLLGALSYRLFVYAPGNCFDAIMNEGEAGVDCGGKCVRICALSVTPPSIVWADSFKIADGQYNAVAYIQNKNSVAGTPALSYTFQLFDGDTIVAERKGVTVLPPNSEYPIFEGRIQTNGKNVTNTKLVLDAADMWVPASLGREQFRTSNLNLSGVDVKPRLDVKIENTELTKADKIEVVATLFNDAGKAVTASQTFIDALEGRATKDIVFTWPNPIAKTVRSCSIPSDVIIGIDLSGSMDNDGGTPPQPVTGALAAAKDFAARLGENDQAAVVTFASQATTNGTLTKDHIATANLIQTLSIAPAEQTGYTNTPALFKSVQEELASPRHSGDARRALVLLTDGLPTAKGDTVKILEETKQAAKEVSDSGVEVYVIGLGKGVDFNFIKSLTPDTNNAFLAPTAGDLDGIYKKITGSLCESGTTKIDVIAKTPTNFTPLR